MVIIVELRVFFWEIGLLLLVLVLVSFLFIIVVLIRCLKFELGCICVVVSVFNDVVMLFSNCLKNNIIKVSF